MVFCIERSCVYLHVITIIIIITIMWCSLSINKSLHLVPYEHCVGFDARRLQASSFPGKAQVHTRIDAGGACLIPERRVLTKVK